MKKALQSMVNKHFSTLALDLPAPSKQVLDVIVESSNGDIRSAINTLEFACTVELPSKKRRGVEGGATIVLEAVTRREQSLALFHLIGKALYNKRTSSSYIASPGKK
jgi:cell cycle checkpoint protein